ncbi:MAG: 2-deoxy-D-gluconate 3-dehydrogenase [Rhodospirillales bacterium RIFCSPLOWO2_01_FULL_65_14]|nr:MAG: 2-deoxy-D-gluconate 3-dehydrogenase [Rhodospirillales bacterium RIFCSPLOWO2_01_FULL_65_14]
MNDLFDLSGKVALVTGASSGLGRHFAIVLARAGAHVAACARRADKLAETVAEIESGGGRALGLGMDVTDADSIEAAFAAAEGELGPVTLLINNAGIAERSPALEVTEEQWDRVMDTNLKGAWMVAQEAARRMAKAGTGGVIVNTASILGFRVSKGITPYAISKAGVVQMTKSLALELAQHNIRVNAIAPGYIETDINRDFLKSEAAARMIKNIPQRRPGTVDDLTGALLLLASDASSYMTGAVVAVDGGHLVSSL